MASIAQAQAQLLDSGFLDEQARGLSGRDATDLPAINAVLAVFAKQFIEQAKANLIRAGAIDTGKLESDLTFEIEHTGNSYTLTVGYPSNSDAASYYDFVNKGVRGVVSGNLAPGSKYQFKYKNPGGPLQRALSAWIIRHGISNRNEDQKHNLSLHQTKRKSVAQAASQSDKVQSIAYAMGRAIKSRGLKRTGYFDDAVNTVFDQDFKDAIARAIGAEVSIQIRQFNSTT